MNAPISTDATLSLSEADAESIDLAIEEAMDSIIQMRMDLDASCKDADGAMDVLHRLLVAKVQIRRAISGEVSGSPREAAE